MVIQVLQNSIFMLSRERFNIDVIITSYRMLFAFIFFMISDLAYVCDMLLNIFCAYIVCIMSLFILTLHMLKTLFQCLLKKKIIIGRLH